MPNQNLPEVTGSKQDQQTVDSKGQLILQLPEGMSIRNISTHVDERGMVCEMYDPRWGWHDEAMVFSYFYTIRPGVIKGWGMHKKHEDRYFVMFGEMELVLYDARENSKTKGLVTKIYVTEFQRCVLNIPSGVWHANRNVGLKDLVIVNFPTIQYEHQSPDKYRLPLDTDQIPYKFHNPQGW